MATYVVAIYKLKQSYYYLFLYDTKIYAFLY